MLLLKDITFISLKIRFSYNFMLMPEVLHVETYKALFKECEVFLNSVTSNPA